VGSLPLGDSLPWPPAEVHDPRICAGSPPVAAMIASPTVSDSRPVNSTKMRNLAVLADHHVTLPASGDLAAGDLGRARIDVDRLLPDPQRGRRTPATLAGPAARAQADQLSGQGGPRLDAHTYWQIAS